MHTYETELTIDAPRELRWHGDVKPDARPDGFRHLVRSVFVKRPYADVANLNGKTTIVTGASPTSIGCDTARIVSVVSHLLAKGSNDDLFGRTHPYGSWAACGNSKLALAHMSTEIQRRNAESAHLQAYYLHPGSVFTKVADKGLEGVRWAEKLRTALARIEAFFLKSPEEGAQTSIHCAAHPDLKGSRYFAECAPLDPGADAQDLEIAARLWQETHQWIMGDATRD